MRKLLGIVLSLVLILTLTAPAMAENAALSFGRISVAMPHIVAEIKGHGYTAEDVAAYLDAEALAIEDVARYDPLVHSTRAYILLDLSATMRDSFDLMKENIVKYIESLGQNDELVLITFGEQVTTVLNGDEDRDQAIEVVENLVCDEAYTMLYEALSQAYQLSAASVSEFDREYIVAFTDAVDDQIGKMTFDEVRAQYDSRELPLYAACSPDTYKTSSDRLGELARLSGGSFSIIDNEDSFAELLAEINDVTLIKMQAASNYADGKERQLSIQIGASQVEYNVPIIRSQPDTTAPQVTQVHYDADKGVFVITFSEKVLGASEAGAYKILNARGNVIAVSDVHYSESDNAYSIQTSDSIHNGIYTIEISDITDASKELNVLSEKKTVNVEDAKHTSSLSVGGIVLIAVGAVVLLALLVLVIVLLSKKRTNEESDFNATSARSNDSFAVQEYDSIQPDHDEVKHHIKTVNAVRVRLKIKTGKTSEQNIETNLISSLIIGRSDTCDIYIDDTKLSRQHFVIEHDNGNLFVMDLQSRNGTMLNGIRVTGRRALKSGDKILAGLSDIMITILR